MRKINILIVLGLVICASLIGFVSASNEECYIGERVTTGEGFDVTQTCPDCTYVELVSVKYPNGTTEELGSNLTKIGESYKKWWQNTTQDGIYEFNTCGDLYRVASNTRVPECENICYEVTPSGKGGTENIVFFIFIIGLIYSINLFGFFGRNIPMTLLGGMALIFLGIYMINHGIIIYRDTLTNYVAYITIAWGFISSMLASYELIQDM